jgi:hypothetical protein
MVRARVVPVSGPVAMVGLSALYAAAMAGSHPLAKRAGAWPSVVAVAAVTAAASELVTRIVPPRDPVLAETTIPLLN